MLPVRGQALIAYHIRALAQQGVRRVLINTAWLEDKVLHGLGESYAGVALHYSTEGRDFGYALETAGGIARALPYLADSFWVAAGDVFAPDFDFAQSTYEAFCASEFLAQLYLVPNPAHHPEGDFILDGSGSDRRYTFSTIALYKKAFFTHEFPEVQAIAPGNPDGIAAPLAPRLRAGIAAGVVTTRLYDGLWVDVGTPERLAALNTENH
jgi:MurNAc alpha-1-phosphate uridylyltransferase